MVYAYLYIECLFPAEATWWQMPWVAKPMPPFKTQQATAFGSGVLQKSLDFACCFSPLFCSCSAIAHDRHLIQLITGLLIS
jgi:hypothetical protein